jgi:ribosomal protein S18 acetylase RimI-like enzyme
MQENWINKYRGKLCYIKLDESNFYSYLYSYLKTGKIKIEEIKDSIYIISVHIEKEYRNNGNGTKLMNLFLKNNNEKIYLIADKRENGQCWKFYRRSKRN